MTTKKRDSYTYEQHNNQKVTRFTVKYDLTFVDGKLEEVRNEYGHLIEKKSERYQYFLTKYNS